MATVGVVWNAEMAALKREWAQMPETFATEADHRAEEAAQGAAVAIRTVYSQHWVTGTLARRVAVTRHHRGKLLPGWSIASRAPHTHLFEYGTKDRAYITKPGKTPGSGGKPHRTGRMWKGAPPGPFFFPTVNRFRRQLEAQLVDMLERAGLRAVKE